MFALWCEPHITSGNVAATVLVATGVVVLRGVVAVSGLQHSWTARVSCNNCNAVQSQRAR